MTDTVTGKDFDGPSGRSPAAGEDPVTKGDRGGPKKGRGLLALFLAVLALGISVTVLLLDQLERRGAQSELDASLKPIQSQVGQLETRLTAQEETWVTAEGEITGFRVRQQQLEAEMVEMDSRFSASLDRLNTAASDLAMADREFLVRAGDLVRGEVQDLAEQVSRQLQLEDKAATQPDLAEVEYLLRTASYLLTRLHDVEGGIQALRKADSLLLTSSFSGVSLPRQQVNQVLGALEKLDMSASLQVQELLAGMRLLVDELEPALIAGLEKADPEPSSSGWRNWYQRYLAPQIRYRRSDELPRRLADGEQLALVRQRMGLALDFADYALLRFDQDRFLQELRTVSVLAARYFDVNDEAGQRMLLLLKQAGEVEVVPEMPDLEPLILAVASLRRGD